MIGKIEDGKFKRYDAGNGSMNIDTELSLESENPVTNRVITEKINEIDEQISTNASNIAQLSNPNLLINPDFKINSNGASEYTTKSAYTVDRWQLARAGSLTVVDDGISIVNNGTDNAQIHQYIDNPTRYEGKTVTLSISINSKVISATGVVPTIDGNNTAICACIYDSNSRAQIRINNNQVCVQIWNNDTTAITINWVKLELGNIATPFVPPNFEEEKLKCGVAEYLPLTGGTVNGHVIVDRNTSFASLQSMRTLSDGAKISARMWAGTDGDAVFALFNEDTNLSVRHINLSKAKGFRYVEYDDSGVSKGYDVHTTKNKPTGTYTGNGDATKREIATGGLGLACYIHGGGFTTFLGINGGITVYYANGTVAGIKRAESSFENGKITLATTNGALNGNGLVYTYGLL